MRNPPRRLVRIFASAFAVGFSGAVAPGPLLLVCAHQALTGGFIAGMTTVVGHAAMELLVVAAMLAGLGRMIRNRPRAFRFVKLGAGVVLVALGGLMLASAPSAQSVLPDRETARSVAAPLLMGAAVSIGNPYFVIWWATVGLGLLGTAAASGRAAVATFYVGHILSDFVWFGFVAAALVLGRKAILGLTSYRLLLGASGLFMIAFGVYFALARGRQCGSRDMNSK